MEVNQNEVWPYNLLCRIFNQEELEILKWNAPKELEAFLIYTVRDAYSDWEADIIVLHFMEQMPPEAIAKKMRRQKERIDEVIANAGDKLKDPLLMDTYRNGLAWRVTNELQKAYIAGYRKGYTHAIKGMEEKVGDHGNAFTNLFFDLPGHNHPVAFLEPSEETYNAMYFAGIHDVKELLEADGRKLMTEFRLDQSQINELAELLKKKGYSCILTRARNDITISYWPMNLLMGSLSETSAYHLMCYAPVDLKESFEFVRKVALNGKDEEILKLYYDLEFSLQDIAEELKITDTQVHERIVRALRKLRHPKYFDLIRYGMKTTVREMIRIESECGFQDGFHRGIEERWEDVDEETGEMNVPKDLIPWLQSTPIEDLQLPIRIINCLHRNKVVTVAELVQLRDKEIMAMNGMGKTAIKDIRKKQSAYIKELLIELVTNEITEISTREVVNNLGGTV